MKKDNRLAFSIVEVITAVSIVAIMIAILIPAMAAVRKTARKVRQQAQFTTLTVGLESFKNDFGYYPDSSQFDRNANEYNGAQKLAEAMFGQDLLGVHPSVAPKFDYEGKNLVFDKAGSQITQLLYTADTTIKGYNAGWQTDVENVQCRKGPYIEAEKAGVADLRDIYPGTGNLYVPAASEGTMFVISDTFAKKNSTFASAMSTAGVSKKTVGMPVLYFKADTRKIQQRDKSVAAGTTPVNADRIYNWEDNKDIIECGTPWDNYTNSLPSVDYLNKAALSDTDRMKIFADMIINPMLNVGNRQLPYNSKSYILVSAGEDGFFGTEDDVYNFDKIK